MKKNGSIPTTITSFLNLKKTTEVKLAGHKIFDEYQAKDLGTQHSSSSRWTLHFLQLSTLKMVESRRLRRQPGCCLPEVFAKLAELGATRIQLDEPALVKDLTAEEKALFLNLYNKLLADKKGLEVLIQTYLVMFVMSTMTL